MVYLHNQEIKRVPIKGLIGQRVAFARWVEDLSRDARRERGRRWQAQRRWQAGTSPADTITSGTPAAPHAISYRSFAEASFAHRISPGTPVYGDLTSLAQLPAAWGYQSAALVLATVVSRPRPGRVTCDAGHKAVGADAGVPTCAVLGHPDWEPGRPSEEHLPIDLPPGAEAPPPGAQLYLVPRHICPTINNFDAAAIVADGRAVRLEGVPARGHETGVL